MLVLYHYCYLYMEGKKTNNIIPTVTYSDDRFGFSVLGFFFFFFVFCCLQFFGNLY